MDTTVGSTVVDPKTKETVTFSLYHLKETTDMGFKIQKPICWKKMVDLFNEPSTKVETITVQLDETKTEKVTVLGSIVF